MTVMSPRTIEAAYENGLLRPLEPIQDLDNQVYLVTILDLDAFRAKSHPQRNRSLRGKYCGYLSSADEFSRDKQTEKTRGFDFMSSETDLGERFVFDHHESNPIEGDGKVQFWWIR